MNEPFTIRVSRCFIRGHYDKPTCVVVSPVWEKNVEFRDWRVVLSGCQITWRQSDTEEPARKGVCFRAQCNAIHLRPARAPPGRLTMWQTGLLSHC
jgi:hypothetical protein